MYARVNTVEGSPDGGLTTRNVALVGLVLAAITLGFIYGFYSLGSTEAQAQRAGICPNARLIDEFTGTGSQRTETFDTTGPFRITYDVTSTGEATPNLSLSVTEEERGGVDDASQNGEGTGDLLVDEPSGAYFLNITTSGGAAYTVTVEQCEGGNPSTNPDPSNPKTPSRKTPSPAPKTRPPAPKTPAPAPKAQPDRGTLMQAGGPTTGPVPIMPNGSCPREFPDMRTGGCYST
jgi:hypothetical protein